MHTEKRSWEDITRRHPPASQGERPQERGFRREAKERGFRREASGERPRRDDSTPTATLVSVKETCGWERGIYWG